eukprot:IDg5603t1
MLSSYAAERDTSGVPSIQRSTALLNSSSSVLPRAEGILKLSIYSTSLHFQYKDRGIDV